MEYTSWQGERRLVQAEENEKMTKERKQTQQHTSPQLSYRSFEIFSIDEESHGRAYENRRRSE